METTFVRDGAKLFYSTPESQEKLPQVSNID